MYDLSPQASFQTEKGLSWYKLLRPTSGERLFKVSVNSGLLLQHASAEELVFIMGHELGHGVAKHVEETQSWKVDIEDSQGLTAFLMSMQPHLDSATDEEHFRAQLLIFMLHFYVAGRRYCFHDNFQAMISTHPCWLERIAYLKSSSTLEQLAFINAAVYPQVAANHLVLAKQLDEYQASPVWPLLVDFMEPKLQGSKDDYHKCISIRSRSQQSILLEVAEQDHKP
ncbi:TPA: hypothetical protein ACH3X1_004613 [Trebouxia sp. C0004]